MVRTVNYDGKRAEKIKDKSSDLAKEKGHSIT